MDFPEGTDGFAGYGIPGIFSRAAQVSVIRWSGAAFWLSGVGI